MSIYLELIDFTFYNLQALKNPQALCCLWMFSIVIIIIIIDN